MAKEEFFAAPLIRLQADKQIPFPIYMHLKLNQRYVMLCKVNSSLGPSRYAVYASKLNEIYIPEGYRKVYLDYLRENEPESFRQVVKDEQSERPDFSEALHEETKLLREVYANSYLSTDAKVEILSKLAAGALNAFGQLKSTDVELRRKSLQACTQIADEIIMLACLSGEIYDEIISIRNSKDSIDHSVATSTFSVLFAMTCGIIDEATLGDLATAALFHDIGLKDVPIELANKSENEMTETEFDQYMEHIDSSVAFVRKCFPQANKRVFELIQDHHENYDGSGYPNQKEGLQLGELSQVLRLADWFDHIVTGKVTGTPVPPQVALQLIYASLRDPEEISVLQPELLEKIFQNIFEGRLDFNSFQEGA